MSMMMPPGPAPGLELPPGGGLPGGGVPPMDAMSSTPLPAEGGIEGLMAALGGGGEGGMPPEMGGGMPGEEPLAPEGEELDAVGHIRQAMKHLMMAMAGENDDERGTGIVKGMGALQALLGGDQKRQKVLADAGG